MATARTDWQGLFTPIVTPFTPDGAFDEAAVRKIIDQQIAEGAHGIIAAGSTGEWFSMTDNERIACSRCATNRWPAAGRFSPERRPLAPTKRCADPGGQENRL